MSKILRKKPKVIILLGPTASGKTALSISLAKKIGGEVVSADSRQVYLGLNLGTGKVTKVEMAGVSHHLLDIARPSQVYTASHFVKDARAAIADIRSRGKVPIICGGTGFYIDTLLGRMSIPEAPPNKTLRKVLAKKTAPQLFLMLKKLDSRRAKTIDRHNPVRLIRAIEIAKALGKVPKKKSAELYNALLIGLTLPQEKLNNNIHTRLLSRIKVGMLREAKKLHEKGLSWKRMEELGLEYRYMARHLQGKITKQEMLAKLEAEIIKYSKRQLTWFRHHKDVHWLNPKENKKLKVLAVQFLKG